MESISAATASPISAVPTTIVSGAAISAVRNPAASTRFTAASIARAASSRPKEWRKSIAAEKNLVDRIGHVFAHHLGADALAG